MDDPAVRAMETYAYRQWLMLLDAQGGIVDRAQAKRAGFSDRQIWHRLRSGRWQRVHEGVYATFTGPLPREARLWAAVRRAGTSAVLSHETAAEVQGLIRPTAAGAAIHITVPIRRRPAQRRQIRGVVIHRSDQSKSQLPITWKIPRTRIEDTVLDLIDAAPGRRGLLDRRDVSLAAGRVGDADAAIAQQTTDDYAERAAARHATRRWVDAPPRPQRWRHRRKH